MNTLVFPGDSLSSLRAKLLEDSPAEAGALLLAGWSQRGDATRLLVRETIHVPQGGYSDQSAVSLSISPTFVAAALKRARLEAYGLVLVHTHPFSQGPVAFSSIDDDGERLIMPSLFGRAPQRPHGALVLGRRGQEARFWTSPAGPPTVVSRIFEIGRNLRLHERQDESPEWIPAEQFDRNVRAFGIEGQRRLARMTFAVVGVGGTGSIVAQELAYLGVRQLVLIDHDHVAASNLNRLVGAGPESIGRPKVEVMAEHLRRIAPDLRVQSIIGDVRFNAQALRLLDADLIFCCTDSHGSRAVLNQLAYQYMIPLIDMGVRIDAPRRRVQSITGRVQMLAPGLPCLVCRSFLDSEEVRRDLLTDEERARDPYIVGGVEPQPSVISLNGTVSSMAVTMMLAAVTGVPSDARYQLLIGTSGTVRAVASPPVADCIVCSLNGALGRGDAWPLPGRPS